MKTVKQIEKIGFGDGREAAIEQGATEALTEATGSTEWDSALINALGDEQTAKIFGLRSLYADGALTDQATEALAAYTKGCNSGWNKHLVAVVK
jgi:hypothetical protein